MERTPRRRLARRLCLAAALLAIALPAGWIAFRAQPVVRTAAPSGGAPAAPGAAAPETASASRPETAPHGGLDADGGGPGAGGAPAGTPADPGAQAAAAIRGVVVTPEGGPIAGARIDAERRPEAGRSGASGAPAEVEIVEVSEAEAEALIMATSASVSTDARGRFEIGGLIAGSYDLEVTARGFGRRRVPDAPARESERGEASLRIVLEPELFLRGQVVDRRAQAIAGAEVTLTFLAADASGLASSAGAAARRPAYPGAVHRARADAEGRFQISGLARGVYCAEAAAEGHAPTVAPLVEVHERNDPEESHLVFELEAGHRLRGVVRAKGGRPLAGARVGLFAAPDEHGSPARSLDDLRVRATLAGADGAFELDLVPEGTQLLAVSACGHRDEVIQAAAGGEPIEVVLDPAPPIEGRVIDRRSGAPVPEAKLSRLSGEEDSTFLARTDAQGHFQIDGLAGGRSVLRIDAEGYSRLEVDTADQHAAGGWTLALERGGSVSGRVLPSAKLPVEGLRVSLLGEVSPAGAAADLARRAPDGRSRFLPGVSSTDAAGFYRALVPGSGSYRVIVDGEPWASATSRVVDVPHDRAQIDGVDIALELSGAAQGFVLARDLGGVAGARVRAFPDMGPGDSPQATPGGPPHSGAASPLVQPQNNAEARTDATGAFTLSGLRPGVYRMVADAPGFVTARSESFQVTPGGNPAVQLELEPEMMISGRVVDEAGEPVPMAEVRAFPGGEDAGEPWSEERSRSSVLGTFRLTRLAARSYDLRFAADGFGPTVVWGVAAGTENVEARLEKLVPLSGKVLGAFTGEPVVEFELRLELVEERRLSAGERESLHEWREFKNAAGAFTIEDLPPGRYAIEATARGHLGLDSLELEVPRGAGLEGAEIRLQEIGLIAGVVVDGHGNTVGGASVEALERHVDPRRGAIVYRPLRVPSPRPEAPETPHAEPGGPPGGSPGEGDGERRGRRRGGEGRDGEDRDDGWVPAAARTREDGSFVIRGLPDGAYRLSVAHDDYLPRELGDFTFEGGLCANPSPASSILLASGVVLRGRVRGLAETEAGSIRVSLRPVRDPADGPDPRTRRGPDSKSARVDVSGHFEIRGLATGDYVLTARFRRADGSYASVRRDVNIHGTGREQGILLDLSR